MVKLIIDDRGLSRISPNEIFGLPSPKIYERVEGRGGTEIGFIAEELPEFLRRGNGYDLKALIAILALKVSKLEEELSKLKSG